MTKKRKKYWSVSSLGHSGKEEVNQLDFTYFARQDVAMRYCRKLDTEDAQ